MQHLNKLLIEELQSVGRKQPEIQTITQISKSSSTITAYPTEAKWLSCLEYDSLREIAIEKLDKLPQPLVDAGMNWSKTIPHKSLYLYGIYGCGKTTFAYAIIREVIRRLPQKCYFWPYVISGPDFQNNLRVASEHRDGDRCLIEKYCDADLLFIDDLDKGEVNQKFKRQLFEIINTRDLSGKPTIITTNWSHVDLAANHDGSIVSRIGDTKRWRTFKFPDVDLRQPIVEVF